MMNHILKGKRNSSILLNTFKIKDKSSLRKSKKIAGVSLKDYYFVKEEHMLMSLTKHLPRLNLSVL